MQYDDGRDCRSLGMGMGIRPAGPPAFRLCRLCLPDGLPLCPPACYLPRRCASRPRRLPRSCGARSGRSSSGWRRWWAAPRGTPAAAPQSLRRCSTCWTSAWRCTSSCWSPVRPLALGLGLEFGFGLGGGGGGFGSGSESGFRTLCGSGTRDSLGHRVGKIGEGGEHWRERAARCRACPTKAWVWVRRHAQARCSAS